MAKKQKAARKAKKRINIDSFGGPDSGPGLPSFASALHPIEPIAGGRGGFVNALRRGFGDSGSPEFMQVLDELAAMHNRKSEDYGSEEDPFANIRNGGKLIGVSAWRACVLRIGDKIQRLQSYCRKGSLTNENVADTFLDLAGYAICALILYREEEGDERW